MIAEARAAGATIGRASAPTFWGGYSGVSSIRRAIPWEVAHNPGWAIDDHGAVTLPE